MKYAILALTSLVLSGCGSDEIFYENGRRMAVFRSNAATRTFSNGKVSYGTTGEDHAVVVRAHWHGANKMVAVLVNGAIQWFTAGSPELKSALGAGGILANTVSTSQSTQ